MSFSSTFVRWSYKWILKLHPPGNNMLFDDRNVPVSTIPLVNIPQLGNLFGWRTGRNTAWCHCEGIYLEVAAFFSLNQIENLHALQAHIVLLRNKKWFQFWPIKDKYIYLSIKRIKNKHVSISKEVIFSLKRSSQHTSTIAAEALVDVVNAHLMWWTLSWALWWWWKTESGVVQSSITITDLQCFSYGIQVPKVISYSYIHWCKLHHCAIEKGHLLL